RGKNKTPDNMYRLAWSLAAIEQYDEAIQLTNDFMNSFLDAELTPKALLIQGYAFGKLDRTPESVSSYQLVVDHFPQTPYAAKALHLMALTYFRNNQFRPIITQLNHQWNLIPLDVKKKFPETLYWIAEAHIQLGNGEASRDYYQKFLDMAPLDHPLVAQALLGQSVSYAVDKDFNTSILTLQRTFQTAQEKNDTAFMAATMLEMGNVFFNAKDYENAASTYRQYQKIDPKHPQLGFSMYQEGLALHRAEYYSDAVAAWENVVKTHPRDAKAPEALFRTAKTRFDLGQYPDAVKNYEQLIRVYPDCEFAKDARLQIGQCYYNAGNFPKAIVHYTDFLDRFPDDEQAPQVLQLLQTCYYQAKKTPEEIDKLTKNQTKSPVLADIYWEEGAKLYNDKAYEKARDYFQKILFEFPSSSLAPQASFYRAESLYLQEKFMEAVPAYENFLQYYPEDPQKSLCMFHLAVCLFNEKEYSKSAVVFQDFAKAFPDDAMAKNANLNAAMCYAKAQEVDNAVTAYQNYVTLYPDSEDVGTVYMQMAQLLEKTGQDEKAAALYRKVPGNLAERTEALFNAGRLYRKLNNANAEKQVYEETQAHSVKNDAYRIAGLLQLAEIYLTQNDKARALAVYQDVAQNAADEASAAMAKEQIQALQGGK
ncbi:MAG: tetratricopeptide repeat protein, partial [Elusimicrobia bacterium]|nr:tetratricopeptide repeat protein [Elusimicrobiota bacterium]